VETRIIYAIIISVVLGGAIGFGLSYSTFNTQIQSLQGQVGDLQDQLPLNWTLSDIEALDSHVEDIQMDLTDVQNNMSSLNTTLSDMTGNSWQLVFSFIGDTYPEVEPNITMTESFLITGQSMLIKRNLMGSLDGYFMLAIYYANGTLFEYLELATQSYWSDYSEIPIKEPGYYYLTLTVVKYWTWDVYIYDWT
jgi:hypothetical protein